MSMFQFGMMFGGNIDDWAVGKSATNYTTMTIQTFCVLLTLILIGVQINYIRKKKEQLKGNWRRATLLYVQLTMMCFSAFYMFTHFWNYVYQYATTPNPIDCKLFYGFLVSSFTFSRIFLMSFLMLRSSFSFEGTFCELSRNITGAVIGVTVLGNLILFPIMVVDNVPTHPIPDKGFCWRTYGDLAIVAGFTFHLFNCVMSTITLVIFYWKAHSVRQMVASLMRDNKFNADMIEIDTEFKKHIKLGMITVAGTILLFFVADVCSVLMGILFALDQTANNILTFIMFKDNQVVYQWLCCFNSNSQQATDDHIHMVVEQEQQSHADSQQAVQITAVIS